MTLGAHVSIEGGVHNAPENGVRLGCDAIQIFSKNQRQWAAKPLTDADADAFREAYRASKLRGVLVHDTYLINCASPDTAMWNKSRAALQDEVERCDRLGIPLLNMHPGAHMDTGAQAGCARIGDAMRRVLDATSGSKVMLLLESMAGQGTTLGHRFEDLAQIRQAAGNDRRIGYCLDTAHLFAAGFDFTTPDGYRQTLKAVDEHLGVSRVRAFHLNDSKTPLGGRVDRHENIGKGLIGATGFQPLLRDARFEDIPMVLETPGGDEGYVEDLRILRNLTK